MILTGEKITKEIELGNICIDPYRENNINPNSYDYTLGTEYLEVNSQSLLDPYAKYSNGAKQIPADGLTLQPGRLYLCSTGERIGSPKYVTSLIGKSSLGRLGLFLQIAANIGHQDSIHHWTLELRCCIPIVIYPGMVIGQVSFWKTQGDKYVTNGRYKNFDIPTSSKGL